MKKINYADFKKNGKQIETYNFQKVSAILADYGFATLRLSDDWQGADFLAVHIDGKTVMKVQLKSRLTFDKKYVGKDLFVCFPYCKRNSEDVHWYLFNHDEMLDVFMANKQISLRDTSPWVKVGNYSWPDEQLSRLQVKFLEQAQAEL
jgi:hypothetical protein